MSDRTRGRQPRRYKNRQRAAAIPRAFAGARLFLKIPDEPETLAEAARLVGTTPQYIAAAVALLEGGSKDMIDRVLEGRLPLLEAGKHVRRRARLVKAWEQARPSDLKAFGAIVGVDRIFDEAIAPSL
jgi:hypothetical protein